MTLDQHAPDPRFVEFLDWQLRSTLRRAASVPARPRWTYRKTAALLGLISLGATLGASGTLSAQQLMTRASREHLLRQIDIQLNVAKRLRGFAHQDLQTMIARHNVAAVPGEALEAPRMRLSALDARIGRLTLDREEVQLTGSPPRDQLSAPRVGGRDFVAERLNIDLQDAQAEQSESRAALASAEAKARAGLIPNSDVEPCIRRANAARAAVAAIGAKVELRARYLRHALTAEQTEALALAGRAKADLEQAKVKLETAQRREADLHQRHAAGLVSEVELRAAEADLVQAEADVRMAEEELKAVDTPG